MQTSGLKVKILDRFGPEVCIYNRCKPQNYYYNLFNYLDIPTN